MQEETDRDGETVGMRASVQCRENGGGGGGRRGRRGRRRGQTERKGGNRGRERDGETGRRERDGFVAASYIPRGGRVRTDGPRCTGGGAVSVRGWRDHVTARGRHVRGESRRRRASLYECRVAMWSSRAEPINTVAGCWQSQESTKLCTRDYAYHLPSRRHHYYRYHHSRHCHYHR